MKQQFKTLLSKQNLSDCEVTDLALDLLLISSKGIVQRKQPQKRNPHKLRLLVLTRLHHEIELEVKPW